jgi:hypothetical protein
MLGPTASKVAASAVLLLVPAIGTKSLRGSIAENSPPPITSATIEANSLLVATLANGEVETHWLPKDVCERVVAELASGSKVSGIRSDGTRLPLERASCSLRNAQLDIPATTP